MIQPEATLQLLLFQARLGTAWSHCCSSRCACRDSTWPCLQAMVKAKQVPAAATKHNYPSSERSPACSQEPN